MLNVTKTKDNANRYPPKLNAVDSFSVAADNSSLEGVDTFSVTYWLKLRPGKSTFLAH